MWVTEGSGASIHHVTWQILVVICASQPYPSPLTYPPRNSRPYDQGLWKPIDFPALRPAIKSLFLRGSPFFVTCGSEKNKTYESTSRFFLVAYRITLQVKDPFKQYWLFNINYYWKKTWVVVSNIFYVQPYLGKIPILTNIFQKGLKPVTERPLKLTASKVTLGSIQVDFVFIEWLNDNFWDHYVFLIFLFFFRKESLFLKNFGWPWGSRGQGSLNSMTFILKLL